MAATTACSFEKSRPARMMSLGECFATVLTKKAPKLPGETPVVRTTLPLISEERSTATCVAVVEAVYSVPIIYYAQFL